MANEYVVNHVAIEVLRAANTPDPTAADVFHVAIEVLRSAPIQAPITVSTTTSDTAEELVVGNIYYRKIVAPTDFRIDTVWFQVGQTSASTQIVGRVYSDNAGTPDSLLVSSNTQTGTAADIDDDLLLTTTHDFTSGEVFWVAIEIITANVNGKTKSGGKGKKYNGVSIVDTADGYMIWASGTALATESGVPLLAISEEMSVAEGGTFNFDVTREISTSGSTTVDWAVTGSGGDPADAADFSGSLPFGTLTFNDTESLKTISFSSGSDTTFEPDETFTITLSNASGEATIGTATSTGTILNDDSDGRGRRAFALAGSF